MSIVHRRRIMEVVREVGLKCAAVAAFVVGVEVILVEAIVVLDLVVSVELELDGGVSAALDVEAIVVLDVEVSAALDVWVIVVVVVVIVMSGCWFVKLIRNIITHKVQTTMIGQDSLLRSALPLSALHPLNSLLQ
jgi:hypothetical protein